MSKPLNKRLVTHGMATRTTFGLIVISSDYLGMMNGKRPWSDEIATPITAQYQANSAEGRNRGSPDEAASL
jgi:hypothetical protein